MVTGGGVEKSKTTTDAGGKTTIMLKSDWKVALDFFGFAGVTLDNVRLYTWEERE